MSHTDEAASNKTEHHSPEKPVVVDSDVESVPDKETFEDAVDTVPARPLTSRVVSQPRTPALGTTDQHHHSQPTNGDSKTKAGQSDANTATVSMNRTSSSSSSRRILETSNLEHINLKEDGTSPDDEVKSISDNSQTGKTLSLSSITSALPAMPWSPPSTSPSRSPSATVNAAIATPSPAVPTQQQQPQPTRKLTGPFAWLSRNSNSTPKEATPSPPVPPSYGRRNTASSIATLTSNPEMMLGKLEEEGQDTTTKNESARNSLKDRFKLLRMQQEAGITIVPGEEDKFQEAKPGTISLSTVSDDTANSELGQPSPVPTPSADLAPGTASGVNAGPSAIQQEAQVDWDLWQSVVYEGPAAVARTSPEELNRAIATGIPSAIRGVIWQVLAQSKNDELEVAYKELVARGTDKEKNRNSSSTTGSVASTTNTTTQTTEKTASSASSVHSTQSSTHGSASSPTDKTNDGLTKAQAEKYAAERKKKEKEDAVALQKLEKVIRRDMGARTSYSKYAAAAGLQDGLFGVCKAYALYDEDVGYAQGMNFLIMPILFNMPEQEAFCLLVRLMNAYGLRDLFVQDMPGLHMHLYQFERLLEDIEPALYCHLHRRGISPHLYATQWFLTLFAYRFPLQLVLRIYDLILSEGLSAILRFGIVLMQKNAETLLGMSDMQQLTTYLKDKLFDVYIDKDPSQGSLLENGFFGSSSASLDKEVYRADQLVRDATEVKITSETLKAYTAEWKEKSRIEKEREAELQDLRLANQSYAIQVRKLEERTETSDREQASLATELVHTKVENEELKDENESLKGQVHELRLVIEKQPAELEEAWKLERDDLMKRNESVHEENRKLEQELSELEEELVQTKLRYAEINSQHETLNRKWSDLKRQFA